MSKLEQLLAQRAAMDEEIAAVKIRDETKHLPQSVMYEKVNASGKSNIFFYICVAFLAINYWMLFDTAFAGIKHDNKNIGGELIVNGFIYWYVWKRNGWKPAYGLIIGILTYLALLLIAGVFAIKFSQ